MAPSLVMAFDARGTIMGGLTVRHPGLVIRTYDGDEFRKGARLRVEARGGQVDLEQALSKSFRVRFETAAAGDGHWSGWITFLQPDQLREVPVLRALAHMRTLAQRGVVQYQAGNGAVRLDLVAEPASRPELLSRLRQELLSNKVVASIRIEDLAQDLESWNPRPAILP